MTEDSKTKVGAWMEYDESLRDDGPLRHSRHLRSHHIGTKKTMTILHVDEPLRASWGESIVLVVFCNGGELGRKDLRKRDHYGGVLA
jgi:hypothetical protein